MRLDIQTMQGCCESCDQLGALNDAYADCWASQPAWLKVLYPNGFHAPAAQPCPPGANDARNCATDMCSNTTYCTPCIPPTVIAPTVGNAGTVNAAPLSVSVTATPPPIVHPVVPAMNQGVVQYAPNNSGGGGGQPSDAPAAVVDSASPAIAQNGDRWQLFAVAGAVIGGFLLLSKSKKSS